MDVLSRNLDGAGPLRTVSPAVVARRWRGRPDRESVVDLGRSTGARTAVYGALLRSGSDSVRARTWLVDVESGGTLAEFERRDLGVRLDRLTDSVTVSLLRELTERRPKRGMQHRPLGAVTSYPALKAFLQGEYHYRRSNWDSSIVYYERAIEADSNFALAVRRLAMVFGWVYEAEDSLVRAYDLRAGALNHGLAPRDSLMIVAESLGTAARMTPDPRADWAYIRRLHATLDAAARLYRDDPEVWYAVGEARYHFERIPELPWPSVLDAFDRAIALDSGFAPAYVHPIEVAFNVGGAPLALPYARAYLAIHPAGDQARGIALAVRLVEEGVASSAVRRLVDSAPAEVVRYASSALRHWPDSAETALYLARALAEPRREGLIRSTDSTEARLRVARMLAYRGHMREAATAYNDTSLWNEEPRLLVPLALFGAMSRDVIAPELARWLATHSRLTRYALPLWTDWGDTASLRDYVRSVDSVARMPGQSGAWHRVHYDSAAARAYLALARRDTAEAVRRFAALPDTLCRSCFTDRLRAAQLLRARANLWGAWTRLGDPRPAWVTPIAVLLTVERGRVAEQLGDRQQAVAAYRFVADVWRHADAELQPIVQEARAALRRLGATNDR